MKARAAVYQQFMPADEKKFLDLSATRLHMIDMPMVQIGDRWR